MNSAAETNSGRMARVDVEFLAKCLGIDPATIQPYMLQNWNQTFAARAITDAHRPYNGDRMLAEIALPNAEAWITRAYDYGRADGIRQERERWERKITQMFGVKSRV